MAIPFVRTTRSFQADRLGPLLVGLSLATVMLLAWMIWFFAAQIPLYVTGEIVQTTSEGMIVAEFPAAARRHLQRNQAAAVRPQGDHVSPPPFLSARVADVSRSDADGRMRVHLYAQRTEAPALVLQEGMRGRVEVTVDHVSPAALVSRPLELPLTTTPAALHVPPR